MTNETLEITWDGQQRRTKHDHVSICLLGKELYDPDRSDAEVMILPIVGCVALKPRQMELAWFTSNSGDYAKPTIGAGYEVKTSGKWVGTVEKYAGAGYFLLCQDATGEYARTQSAIGKNRGMQLSLFIGSAGDNHVVCECGWSDSTAPTAASAHTGLQIWSSGEVLVYRGGEIVKRGNVGPGENGVQNLILLPCRRRELLVMTVGGNGFRTVFREIDDYEANPEITPNTKFFVTSPGGSALTCQFSPLRFPTSGWCVSSDYYFPAPPQTGQTLVDDWQNPVFSNITNASLYGDSAFAGTTGIGSVSLNTAGNVSTFIPDGETDRVVINVQLTGDGSYTPFLYAAHFMYRQVFTTTDNSEEVYATEFLRTCELVQPDDAFGLQVQAKFNLLHEYVEEEEQDDGDGGTVLVQVDKEQKLSDFCPNYYRANRPMQLWIGDIKLFDGRIESPRVIDGRNSGLQWLELTARALPAFAEKYLFRSRIPLDGISLCRPISEGWSVMSLILESIGIDPDLMELSDLEFSTPEIPDETCEEFNLAIESGDSGRDAWDKAVQLASDVFYGVHPVLGPDGVEMGFWVKTRQEIDEQEPVIKLYRTVAEAMDDTGLTKEEAYDLLYDKYEVEPSAIEGTQIRAAGINPRTKEQIISLAVDEDAQDPELPPSEQPPNWVGDILPVGVLSRSFTSQEAADKAVESLIDVVTGVPDIGSFEANTMLFYERDGYLWPVWRGDRVTLDGIGDVTITSLRVEFLKEVPAGMRGAGHVRKASYTFGTPYGNGGSSIASIQRANEARLVRRSINNLLKNPMGATGIFQSNRVQL